MNLIAFFGMGPWEIAIIAVIALLLIGPAALPSFAKGVGGAVYELRKMVGSFNEDMESLAERHESKDAE